MGQFLIDFLAARADLKEAQPHGQHYKLGRQKYGIIMAA